MPEDREKLAQSYFRSRYSVYFLSLAASAAFVVFFQFSGLSLKGSEWVSGLTSSRAFQIAGFLAVFHGLHYAVLFPAHFFGSYLLEKKYGLSAEPLSRWAADELKAGGMGFVLLVFLVEAFYLAVLPLGRHWWAAASLGWAFTALVLARVLPGWIVPLFYPMKPLDDGPLRDRLTRLAAEVGVPARGIYEISLSRKTKKANAAVIGIGKSRRIVLGDTLIRNFTPEEIEVVLGHELAHYKERHVRKMLAFRFAATTLGFWLLGRYYGVLARFFGVPAIADVASYPFLALCAGVFEFLLLPLQNGLSRRFETAADVFAVRVTRSREAFVSAMRKLASQNLAPLSPHPLIEWIFFSHPAMERRLRAAEAA